MAVGGVEGAGASADSRLALWPAPRSPAVVIRTAGYGGYGGYGGYYAYAPTYYPLTYYVPTYYVPIYGGCGGCGGCC